MSDCIKPMSGHHTTCNNSDDMKLAMNQSHGWWMWWIINEDSLVGQHFVQARAVMKSLTINSSLNSWAWLTLRRIMQKHEGMICRRSSFSRLRLICDKAWCDETSADKFYNRPHPFLQFPAQLLASSHTLASMCNYKLPFTTVTHFRESKNVTSRINEFHICLCHTLLADSFCVESRRRTA